MCRLNLPPHQAVRGPGSFQAAVTMQHILDHVAAVTGLDPTIVRERNFLRPSPPSPFMGFPAAHALPGENPHPPPPPFPGWGILAHSQLCKTFRNFDSQHEVPRPDHHDYDASSVSKNCCNSILLFKSMSIPASLPGRLVERPCSLNASAIRDAIGLKLNQRC